MTPPVFKTVLIIAIIIAIAVYTHIKSLNEIIEKLTAADANNKQLDKKKDSSAQVLLK